MRDPDRPGPLAQSLLAAATVADLKADADELTSCSLSWMNASASDCWFCCSVRMVGRASRRQPLTGSLYSKRPDLSESHRCQAQRPV